MVVGECKCVEKIDKNFILTNPAASNERVCKVITNHGIVIETNQLIDFDLRFLYLSLCSLLLGEDS
jgi:hypothetical protein